MTVEKLLDTLLDALLMIILAAMSLVVAANVFCRFVLNFSLYWGDESAQILLVWLTFLGAAVAVREQAHYALNYLSEQLAPRPRRALLILRSVLSVVAIVVLLYYSARVTQAIENWVMPATEISRAWVYGACPLGCIFMLYYALRNLWNDLNSNAWR